MPRHVRVAFIAVLLWLAAGLVPAAAETPTRTADDLAAAVERRASATDFARLEAFGQAALSRRDREGLNRIYHVAWTILNQGDFERAGLWNRRLAEGARAQNDERYIRIAALNDLTLRYDQGDTAAAAEMAAIAANDADWFVKAHATRLYALALMDEDRIGEGLRMLADMEADVPADAPYADTARAGLREMAGIGLMKLNDVAGATDAFGRFEIDFSDPAYPRPDFDSLYNLARMAVQMGDHAQAARHYAAHHRLAVRANLESLSVYDANLCAMTAAARGASAEVLACLAPYGESLGPAEFLAPQMLPARAIARARLGRLAAARRDLAEIHRRAAADAFREEGVSLIPLVEAEVLFAEGRTVEAYRALRAYSEGAAVGAARRFSAGMHQVTGDMQQQLAERRRQLETARANTELQRDVIASQNRIVGIGVLFLLSAIATLAWQWRQTGQLRAARGRAEAASRAKSEFLANMSHEIRTPLNGVVAMADALTRRDLDPADREMVEIIRSSGGTLERLLSDILDSARIESGQVQIEPAPFDLGQAVRDVAALWRQPGEAKGVEVEARVDPAVDRTVEGDVVRVRQVLTNLVSNALKFTAEGSVTVTAEPGGEGRVRFTVADTGVGFDGEQKQRIFGRFQQADGSITRRFGGTGLGLAISSDLVGLMGGTLECESAPGVGSTFWFEIDLPAANAAPAADEAPPANDAACDVMTAPLRVLLADDHPANRKVVEVMLAASAMELVPVEDGRKALEAFMTGGFDIVLMDMQMPVMDGLTATRAIRAFEAEQGRPRTPILMLTANAMAEHVEAGRLAGADGHLTKPITVDGLFAGIAGAVVRPPVARAA